jgi:hypothetical protein
MSQTSPTKVEQCPADLKALHSAESRGLLSDLTSRNQRERPVRIVDQNLAEVALRLGGRIRAVIVCAAKANLAHPRRVRPGIGDHDISHLGIVSAVSAAVHADKTLDTVAVKPLEYEDCQWIFEGGMPMPDYGVTVGQDGSWHSDVMRFPEKPEARGKDLQSLFDFLVEKGRIRR